MARLSLIAAAITLAAGYAVAVAPLGERQAHLRMEEAAHDGALVADRGAAGKVRRYPALRHLSRACEALGSIAQGQRRRQ